MQLSNSSHLSKTRDPTAWMELSAGNWEISGPGGLFEENFTHFHAYGIKSCHYEVNTLQMKNNALGTCPVCPQKLTEATTNALPKLQNNSELHVATLTIVEVKCADP